MKAILHIGAEKTGTSSLQRSLHLNRSMLLQNGYYFSRAGGEENNFKLFLCGLGNRLKDDPLAKRIGANSKNDISLIESSIRSSIANETINHPEKAFIFSSEHLQARLRTPQEISSIKHLLSEHFDTFEIVIYLRNPIEYARSLFSTSLKFGGLNTSFPSVATTNGDINYRFNYKLILKNWQDVFYESKFTVKIYDRTQLMKMNIIDDFYHLLQLNNLPRVNVSKTVNTGLDMNGQSILAFLNKLQKSDSLVSKSIANKRKKIISYLEDNYPGDGLYPTLKIKNEFKKKLYDSDEWVRQTYFPNHKERIFNYDVPLSDESTISTPSIEDVSRCLIKVYGEL